LARHLLDAAAMALCLWDRYLSVSQRRCIAEGLGLAHDLEHARRVVGLCAGLHDIGKISGFQFCEARAAGYLSAELTEDRGKIGIENLSHDRAGMSAVGPVLRALGFDTGIDAGLEATVARVAEIVGGHHGRFYQLETGAFNRGGDESLLGGPSWTAQRAAHAFTVFDALGEPSLPPKFGAASGVLVTGVVILADWLVSQEHHLKRMQRRLGDLSGHFAAAQREAPKLVKEVGLSASELQRKSFAEAYGIDGEPNPLQRSVATDLPQAVAGPRSSGKAGIALVTAAPGDGKSEAALEIERVLSAAFGTRGFAFLLPTMATSDQMHGRVAGVLARQGGVGSGLTLTHSMAWLSKAYADEQLAIGSPVLVCDGEEMKPGRERYVAQMQPQRWLRGSKRPLLAQYTVGTVDQALMAVLPVRHNALRMLALSGKTFIVDEAHAYDPYMQVLLGRLLNWLGAYGVPVVLLSATLPASVSDRLIQEYLRGADPKVLKEFKRLKELKGQEFGAVYPGWLYVDAETGECTSISKDDSEAQADLRRMPLSVDVCPVSRSGGTGDRLAVIGELVEPIMSGAGGCVLVVCNTVADAQETYTWLKERFVGELADEDLQLLHARYPGDIREERTSSVTEGMGRTGPRPERRIVVATQVVEQSLDLDADLVISDLAPLALLLQRAGRCWRHETWWAAHGRPQGRARPIWAEQTKARLVVLDPLQADGCVPKQWGEIYPEFLLAETSKVLAERGTAPLLIPDDVQELVERVHSDRAEFFDWNDPERSATWSAYTGKAMAERSIGSAVAVPRVGSLVRLHKLHHLEGREGEWEAATRLGAEAVRLLCAYEQPGGDVTLDVAGALRLPQPGGDGRMAVEDVRAVMSRTIPVSADWFAGNRDRHQPPATWADQPMLSELLLLVQPVRDGRPQPVTVGQKELWLDQELGLVRK
jgi:CRISPR-associated endonuclease/helicase Cas3